MRKIVEIEGKCGKLRKLRRNCGCQFTPPLHVCVCGEYVCVCASVREDLGAQNIECLCACACVSDGLCAWFDGKRSPQMPANTSQHVKLLRVPAARRAAAPAMHRRSPAIQTVTCWSSARLDCREPRGAGSPNRHRRLAAGRRRAQDTFPEAGGS